MTPPASGGAGLDGEGEGWRPAGRGRVADALDRHPLGFVRSLPGQKRRWRQMSGRHRRTDGEVTRVTNRAMVVRTLVFVGGGDTLQAHKTSEHQQHQEAAAQLARCRHTNHAPLLDEAGLLRVAKTGRQKMKKGRLPMDGPSTEASLDPAQGRITFSACRPFGPRLTSNSTSQPSSRLL